MNAVFPIGFPLPTAFYLVLLVTTLLLHMVFMHYVLAGSAYLAVGRLMGRQRCERCGWQRALVDWLPFATGLAITAGVAPLLFVQILYQREFYSANLLLSHRWMAILPVLIVAFYLLYLQKSAWIGRRGWGWRIAVAAAAFAGFAFIAWSWTENHLLSLDEAAWPKLYASGELRYATASLPARLAVWFFAAFPTLAIELAWQGRLLGLPMHGGPAAGGEAVAGLSPLRRLAVTALAGLIGLAAAAAAYWPTLTAESREAIMGPLGEPWLITAAVGLAVQAICWVVAAGRDRLPTGLAAIATAGWLAALAGMVVLREVIRLAAVDLDTLAELHSDAAGIGGLPVFLVFAGLNTAAIVWCIRMVARRAAG
jgi:hypothetical protein